MFILSEGAHPARADEIAGPIVIAAVVAAVALINVRLVVMVVVCNCFKFKVPGSRLNQHETWNLEPGTIFISLKICILWLIYMFSPVQQLSTGNPVC